MQTCAGSSESLSHVVSTKISWNYVRRQFYFNRVGSYAPHACADPEHFVREDRNATKNRPPSAHQRNAFEVLLACQWPTIEWWLGSFVIFSGSGSILLGNPIFMWFFRGGGGPDPSADPERGTGGPDPPPPGNSQVIWVSIGNKRLDPPRKSWTPPPGKCWTPSGALKNDRFLWNWPFDFCKISWGLKKQQKKTMSELFLSDWPGPPWRKLRDPRMGPLSPSPLGLPMACIWKEVLVWSDAKSD